MALFHDKSNFSFSVCHISSHPFATMFFLKYGEKMVSMCENETKSIFGLSENVLRKALATKNV